jgi:hypothetical protein
MEDSQITELILGYNLSECGLKIVVAVEGGSGARAVLWLLLGMYVPRSPRPAKIAAWSCCEGDALEHLKHYVICESSPVTSLT